MQRVWYVAYGSNLSRARFGCYLKGGRPPGSRREYAGCRDRRPPTADEPVMITGGLRFVGTSTVWGGGYAIYDPDAAGELAGRAYLISSGQFADVLAQEMRREPGLDLDLTPIRPGGRYRLGAGHYQTLAHVGSRDGTPMLTFTSEHRDDLTANAPSAGYLRVIATGLAESHGWDRDRIGDYLASVPGAAGTWTPASVGALL